MCLFRGVCDLLDPRACGSPPGRTQLRAMRRPQVQALVAPPRRAQLCHEPDHLLLQRRGNVDHHQEPDALRLQRHEASEVVQGQHSTQLGPGDEHQPQGEHDGGKQSVHAGNVKILNFKALKFTHSIF